MSSMLKPDGRDGFIGRTGAGGGSNWTGGARISGPLSTDDSLAAAAAAAAAAASVWRSSAAADEVGTGEDVTEMKESQESEESSDVST